MKAALLEDVRKLEVREVPDPVVSPREVLIQVKAVGVCGTDLHLFQGHGNYHIDSSTGQPIPLTVQPQILGHEFSGEIVEVGHEVTDLRPGARVLCDQGLNCVSRARWPRCSYCASGDSHQCEYYAEHGITGLPGALAEYIAMPAVNCLRVPAGMSAEQGALVEPLGCIIHSSDRVDRSKARYSLEEGVRNILICGAGPSGLLFLQYLRNVRGFEGLILVSDVRQKNLDLAAEFGGTPVNVARQNLAQAVQELTEGERIHYLIEASGSAAALQGIPGVLRKQGTLLLYGAGHQGRDISLLPPVLFLEPTLVASAGASGGFEADGRPSTYRRALEMMESEKIKVLPFITHRYRALEETHVAFERDFLEPDYIKGVVSPG